MISFTISVALGATAGLHAACYGAYKDSPHETFKWARFTREIALATLISAGIYSYVTARYSISPLFYFLVVLALSRILTEGYKLFLRNEPQSGYLIPSQFHFFRKIVTSRAQRALIGVGLLLFIWMLLAGTQFLIKIIPVVFAGTVIGLITGSATALGGGYKDGLFEGFSQKKFFRSPVVGSLGGLFLQQVTGVTHTQVLFFGCIGLERMIVECYKGFLKHGYAPGKFKHAEAPYPHFYWKRRILLAPYLATWAVFVGLLLNAVTVNG